MQLILASSARIAKVLKAGAFRVKASAPGAGIFSMKATIPAKDARRARISAARTVTIAKGKATLLKAGTATVKVKLTKKAKRGLRRLKRVKVTLTSRFTDADGKVTTTKRTISLKR